MRKIEMRGLHSPHKFCHNANDSQSLNIHKHNISKNVGVCQVFFRKIAQVYMSILPPVLTLISILFIIGGMIW